jgi:hypothetical protein
MKGEFTGVDALTVSPFFTTPLQVFWKHANLSFGHLLFKFVLQLTLDLLSVLLREIFHRHSNHVLGCDLSAIGRRLGSLWISHDDLQRTGRSVVDSLTRLNDHHLIVVPQ